MSRRSIAIRRGRYFAATGWGKYGPYAVSTYRRGRAVGKVSVGLRGVMIGGRYRIYKRLRVGGEYNLTHHHRTLEVKTRKRVLRLTA